MREIKKDAMLLIGILTAALLLWLIPFFYNLFRRDVPAMVIVYQDGHETASYPLAENQTVDIPCKDILSDEKEGYNLLFIEDGQAFISDADCPDQLCVRQRSICRDGESIICLPHRLVLQIRSKEESELDAITW